MQIDTKNLVSISEANQNFSKVARLVDENGAAIILKNNTPRYVLIEFSQFQKEVCSDDKEVNTIARRILSKHQVAFEELVKS
ncbi:MAG: prevent-host-death protein [Acetobacterium sp. MES1]|uniref:type II toxin-antitoxin system Phd/YefM family antitoxin n=1 Tax=Acetobacterium sp. MES1 TaxID=1899015 RepID=UPI000B9D248D|nr:type II toxin-antitoxin system Phd/YefM family antitoxin [Acetobacterium sp. MES1]OXS24589.1 MAG: prevent-host-death protein [Acetobacterium sp. MES1]